jgi:hypothetical protein
MRGNLTVTVRSITTTRDKHGGITTSATERDVSGCLFAPATSLESPGVDTPAVRTPATLYMPEGSTLDSDDRVVVRGDTYAVKGDPQEWGMGVAVELTRWKQPAVT